MSKRLAIAVMCLACVATAAADERWIGFDGRPAGSEATVEVLRTGTEIVELELEIPGLVAERVEVDGTTYTRLEAPGLGRIGGVGSPMLPALRRFVEVPQGASATVRATVLERTTLDLGAEGLPGLLYPVQLPMPKCDCQEARDWRFSFDAKAYARTSERREPALTGPFGLRDHRMLLLTAAAASYDPAAGTVEIATRLRITVEISGGDAAATAAMKSRLSSRHFDAFLRDAAVNLNLTDAAGWAYPDSAPVEFLIITPPQLAADLEPFVEWKTSTGYRVSVVTTDVTGTTTSSIKAYITGLYNGPTPPVYILMIGDSPTPLATYTPSGGGTGGTDLPYVQMDGDLYPDMIIARWPVDDASELVAMRDKILTYEQPTAGSSAYLNRALFMEGSGYQSAGVTTHADVIGQLMNPAPNSNENTRWLETQNHSVADLIAYLNTGGAWAVYSAHSGPSGWSGPPSLSSGDFASFTNLDKYPLGFGHSCQSNMWATNPDVFGEVAVTTANKGFVSYWGGSNSTYWDEDDWLERGFFDSMFDADMAGNQITLDRQYSQGTACYAGLTEVTLQGGDESYYWPMYNLDGDPTLDPFTRFPIAMTIGAPPVVPPVADTFTVTVSDGAIGPVPVAMVGVSQDGVLLGAGLTDATGTASFPIDAPSPGSDLLVRVTSHNHLPTDATTIVAAGSDGVVVLDRTIYRCDSTVTINVFDEDLDGAPPFNVTLSAAPSGGSIPVQVSSVGGAVVQFQGVATLGAQLTVAHGDILTVTYNDADTGSGVPGVKTDTAVLDCAGPAITNVGIHEVGAISAVVRWTTDEPGDSWAQVLPGGVVFADSALGLDHELVLDGLSPCTEYTVLVASTDALGNSNSAGPTLPFETWTQAIALDDDVESGPGGWTVDTVINPGTGTNWSIVTDPATSSPTHAWFTSDVGTTKDDRLESGPITLGGGSPVLSFWHHFSTESNYDGGVLEVSTNGSTWSDVVTAGGVFLAGAYNGTANSGPLSGRPFWAGSGSLQQVEVDLSAFAGGDLWIRFRFACDSSVSGQGWWVDDIRIETTAPCDTLFGDGFETGDCSGWSAVVGER
ncbi:MAG: C25 family cysteine peptidase [Thermoanaerobaculales bacterium]|jgi:hypothetical protein|nr:C25 family cysteine peptidase [Thermoanaerobaculales bacterium]